MRKCEVIFARALRALSTVRSFRKPAFSAFCQTIRNGRCFTIRRLRISEAGLDGFVISSAVYTLHGWLPIGPCIPLFCAKKNVMKKLNISDHGAITVLSRS